MRIIDKNYNSSVSSNNVRELNLIEQFWALIKRKVRREKLEDTETLQERRIVGAANEVPIQHFENIIQHSKNQFNNCLNHIPI
ncbi:uncharacterized protein BX663DRAFT_563771 [Cokeromyces recurvatus]|uniref:uncharacterized protein n=1 Tax=Cokeromyces recurvatus TaxID=90255 RepID=UPI00221F3F02|nr:uncharacterized protein BX663DRAFT_563771 [Cokeromyces recurvatus]KAI7899619.1 hypothetical protein BX663DRAFT_563771 [Cokeromyces recurvatus]